SDVCSSDLVHQTDQAFFTFATFFTKKGHDIAVGYFISQFIDVGAHLVIASTPIHELDLEADVPAAAHDRCSQGRDSLGVWPVLLTIRFSPNAPGSHRWCRSDNASVMASSAWRSCCFSSDS